MAMLAADGERQARELAHADLDLQKLQERLASTQAEKHALNRQYETLVMQHAQTTRDLDEATAKAAVEARSHAEKSTELQEQLTEAQRNVESLLKLKERLQRENARLSIDASIARQDIIRLKSAQQQLESEANQAINFKEEARQAQQKELTAQTALERATAEADLQREQHAAEVTRLRRALAAAETGARTRDSDTQREREEELRAARARAAAAEERAAKLTDELQRETERAAQAEARGDALLKSNEELARKIADAEHKRKVAPVPTVPHVAAPVKPVAPAPTPAPPAAATVPVARPAPAAAATELPNYFGLRYVRIHTSLHSAEAGTQEALKRTLNRGAPQGNSKKKMMHVLHPMVASDEE